jgi:enoyl-CoA hydratase
MEMCLTGRMMDAEEAERVGLVSRIVPADDLLDEAVLVAEKIAEKSRPSVLVAKECVDAAYETSLREGVHFERRVFHSLFAFDDQTEGMQAFIDKRAPKFNNK